MAFPAQSQTLNRVLQAAQHAAICASVWVCHLGTPRGRLQPSQSCHFNKRLNRGAQSCCPCRAQPLLQPKPMAASSDFWRKKREGSLRRCLWTMCHYHIALPPPSSSSSSFPYNFVQCSPVTQNVPLPKMQEPCDPSSCGRGEPEVTRACS